MLIKLRSTTIDNKKCHFFRRSSSTKNYSLIVDVETTKLTLSMILQKSDAVGLLINNPNKCMIYKVIFINFNQIFSFMYINILYYIINFVQYLLFIILFIIYNDFFFIYNIIHKCFIFYIIIIIE